MTGGMLPSAIGIGPGGEFRSPMAIAVIGGLLVATLLSLLFVPALFTIMDDVGNISVRLFRRFIGGAHATSVAPKHPAGDLPAAGSGTRSPPPAPDTARVGAKVAYAEDR
jgi:HAE1 family hydrophobic/amphiphilic exporter-1